MLHIVAEQNALPLAGPRTVPPREHLYRVAGDQASVLDRVIRCESAWQMVPNAAGESSAYGYGQFLAGTWQWTREAMGRDPSLALRGDPYEHIDTLVFLWDHGRGAFHWKSSRDCWER